MSNQIARTLKRDIARWLEILDEEIEKLSNLHDAETIALESALLAVEKIPQKEVLTKLLVAIRQLQNHDRMCVARSQLIKLQKTVTSIGKNRTQQ